MKTYEITTTQHDRDVVDKWPIIIKGKDWKEALAYFEEECPDKEIFSFRRIFTPDHTNHTPLPTFHTSKVRAVVDTTVAFAVIIAMPLLLMLTFTSRIY